MAAATARYVISADDQTKAAIDSVRRGFKGLDQGVRATASSMKLALGVFAGIQLKQVFRNVLNETAKSSTAFAEALDGVKKSATNLLAAKSGLPGVVDSMNQLSETLRDPAVVAAADDITSALIRGFGGAAKAIAETIAGLRIIATGKGGNEIVDADNEIRRLEAMRDSMMAGSHGNPLGNQLKQLREWNAEIARLRPIAMGEGFKLEVIDTASMNTLDAYFDKMEEGFERQKEYVESGQAEVDRLFGKYDANARRMIETHRGLKHSKQEEFDAYIRGVKIQIVLTNELEAAIADTSKEISASADDAIKDWADSVEDQVKGVKEVADTMSTAADEAARNVQGAFADFLFDPFSEGLDGMLKGFIDVLRRMIAEAAASQIFDMFGGTAGVGGFLKGIGGAIFGGFKAEGGPVQGGTSYVVGERGPELFTPGRSGMISPNGSGGVVVAPVYNIDARGATMELASALPGILKRHGDSLTNDIIMGIRRGKYIV